MTRPVYLDWNATAPMRPEAAAAVTRAMEAHGNASSVHRVGRAARRTVEDAREAVAALVGARPQGVVFTSGGTEANNLALAGRRRATVIASGLEHASVLEAAAGAALIPATRDGVVDLDWLKDELAREAGEVLVSIMLVNNETGVVQPVAEAAALVRAAGGRVHCDAVQAAGRADIDLNELGVDTLTLSAHKIGGPMGVGALVLAEGAQVPHPVARGGGQERGRRAGTENVPAIAGFGVAAGLAADWRSDMQRIGGLRDALEARLAEAAPEAVIYGAGAPRVANTSLIGLASVPSDTAVMTLDLEGISVSAGAACSSGKVAPSHVLGAMGFDPTATNSAIRVSLGRTSEAADIDRFVTAWTAMRDAVPVSSAA